MAGKLNKLKVKFVAKLGLMGTYEKDGVEKFHIIVPKQHVGQIREWKGKQIKVIIDDEI
ncbi:MAG: hypothetical protein ACR2IS_19625 [Nitrososphaeraceae archaeon]